MPGNSPRWPTDELLAEFNSLAKEAGFPGKHADSVAPSRWHFLKKLFAFGREHIDLLRRR